MHVSRLVIKNFRNFDQVDLRLSAGPNCIVGENNSGKSNLLDALRLVLDQSLPPFARTLSPDDVHSAIDLSHPTDVTIAVEFSDWQESDKECAFAGEWEIQPDVARLTYRFRPRKAVRDDLDAGERPPGSLAIDDYAWELRGGGGIDPLELTWDQDSGVAPRTGCLQAFQVTFLHPLRDVERDLRAVRTSPLNRVIEAIGIPDDEKATLTEILRDANDKIAASPSITTIGQDIEQAFVATTGPASALALRLGLADPSFSTITRLTNDNYFCRSTTTRTAGSPEGSIGATLGSREVLERGHGRAGSVAEAEANGRTEPRGGGRSGGDGRAHGAQVGAWSAAVGARRTA